MLIVVGMHLISAQILNFQYANIPPVITYIMVMEVAAALQNSSEPAHIRRSSKKFQNFEYV